MRSGFRIIMVALAAFALAFAFGACGGGGDDDGSGDVDAAGGGTDAPAACVIPATTTSCTVGTDAPCQALCGTAYCYNFSQLATPVCTQSCTAGSTDQCPSGWTCNNMGRCRPPG
jgi:hypothetical protein